MLWYTIMSPLGQNQKRFEYIPRRLSGQIKKSRFIKEVLPRFLGGSYQGSANVLRRKDLRGVLNKAGVLSLLDPSVKGRKSRSASTLTEHEAVDILKKTRAAIRENLKGKGYGLREGGLFRGSAPRSIYQRSIERIHRTEGEEAQKRQESLEIQKRKLRRREVMRQELGMKPLQRVREEMMTRRKQQEARRNQRRVGPAKKEQPTEPGSTSSPTPTRQGVSAASKAPPAASTVHPPMKEAEPVVTETPKPPEGSQEPLKPAEPTNKTSQPTTEEEEINTKPEVDEEDIERNLPL